MFKGSDIPVQVLSGVAFALFLASPFFGYVCFELGFTVLGRVLLQELSMATLQETSVIKDIIPSIFVSVLCGMAPLLVYLNLVITLWRKFCLLQKTGAPTVSRYK